MFILKVPHSQGTLLLKTIYFAPSPSYVVLNDYFLSNLPFSGRTNGFHAW